MGSRRVSGWRWEHWMRNMGLLNQPTRTCLSCHRCEEMKAYLRTLDLLEILFYRPSWLFDSSVCGKPSWEAKGSWFKSQCRQYLGGLLVGGGSWTPSEYCEYTLISTKPSNPHIGPCNETLAPSGLFLHPEREKEVKPPPPKKEKKSYEQSINLAMMK